MFWSFKNVVKRFSVDEDSAAETKEIIKFMFIFLFKVASSFTWFPKLPLTTVAQ